MVTQRLSLRAGAFVALVIVLIVGSLVALPAHVIRGVVDPSRATAFVSSPSAAADAPVPIAWSGLDTGLRVACFHAANTAAPRVDDAAWPRVTAVGFELPGQLSGFTLISPRNAGWEIVEGIQVPSAGGTVSVDFAIVAPVDAFGRPTAANVSGLLGIPPGQAAARLSGTRFCVSGPFPDGVAIEQIINGVIVRFQGLQPNSTAVDLGVWESATRTIPLFP